jgi:hypothetical protein
MSGVFLSYSRADHALAAQIIWGLRAVGVAVWWDEDMRSVDWQEELGRQINELAGVIVLWTPNSANSRHVKDEARLGLETDKLINASAGVSKPPFPYDRVNALPLDGWTGREPHRGWTRLVETAEEKLVASGGAKSGEITAALVRHEKEVRQKLQAVDRARAAFQAAQAREGDAAEATKAAGGVFDRAEAQHQSVVDMRATPALQRTARQELDDAQTAKEQADRALRAAKAELAEASLAWTRAETALERRLSNLDVPAMAPTLSVATAAEPVKAAEAATPLGRDQPAAPAKAPVRPRRLSWLVVGGVSGVVVIAGAFLVLGHGGSSPPSRRPTNPVSSADAAPVPGGAPAAPAVTAAEAAINGKWTLQSVSCAYAIDFQVQGRALSVGGATMKIASVDPSGVIRTGTEGGYAYSVLGDTLTMTAPNGDRTSYTRCAG